jgi:hypothetical protein
MFRPYADVRGRASEQALGPVRQRYSRAISGRGTRSTAVPVARPPTETRQRKHNDRAVEIKIDTARTCCCEWEVTHSLGSLCSRNSRPPRQKRRLRNEPGACSVIVSAKFSESGKTSRERATRSSGTLLYARRKHVSLLRERG